MNQLEYKNYIGSIDIDIKQGIIYGKLLFISDIVTYEASSIPELSINFHKAVDNYLELCEEFGDTPDIPCKGSFNVRIGPELHRRCAIQANLENISLNEWVRKACESYLSNTPNQKTPTKELLFNITTETSEDIIQFPLTEINSMENLCHTLQIH
jgi:predicted HicB family RNase H-like nuclease